MTQTFLAAESGIQVGHHTEANWFGLTVNTDTILSTVIAAAIVLGLAFYLRAKVTSTGVPNGVQLFWEALTVHALYDGDEIATRETVMTIEGDYTLFAHLETVYLGVLARRTLVSTNTRRVIEAANKKPIIFMPSPPSLT